MKIFLDTADVSHVEQWLETGLIQGITTNPSLLSTCTRDPRARILELSKLLPNGTISVEVTERSPAKVYQQAHAIAALAKNIVVKIPCHLDYYSVIHKLVQDDIKLNITLLFSLPQALCMSALSVHYISAFVGRQDDANGGGAQVLHDIRTMLDTYGYTTQLLAASIRTASHVYAALHAGADIITISPELLRTITNNPLTNQGIEQFESDWKKLGITQFP